MNILKLQLIIPLFIPIKKIQKIVGIKIIEHINTNAR